jgi:hypothetical protein
MNNSTHGALQLQGINLQAYTIVYNSLHLWLIAWVGEEYSNFMKTKVHLKQTITHFAMHAW